MDENNEYEDSNGWPASFNIIGVIIGFVVVFSIIGANLGGSSKYEGQTAEEWFNEYDQCSVNLENYQTAFEEANSKIEEANNNIEDVNYKIEDTKNCSWGCDYEEMQDRIDNLETADTVDVVSEP